MNDPAEQTSTRPALHPDVGGWDDRSETVLYDIGAVPYAALSALLTSPARWPASGTPLPALWHWLYRMPLRHALLAAVPPRRMSWVGCRIRIQTRVRIGDAVSRTSTILRVREAGADGSPLAQLTLRHAIYRNGDTEAAITEDHDIVLGTIPSPRASQPFPRGTEVSEWRRWEPDELRLFRDAALAFDSHRDHTNGGGTPPASGQREPVVEGPLIAMLLQDLLHRQNPEARLVSFRARTVLPLHDCVPFFLHSRPGHGAWTTDLWAEDHRGHLAMAATAILR